MPLFQLEIIVGGGVLLERGQMHSSGGPIEKNTIVYRKWGRTSATGDKSRYSSKAAPRTTWRVIHTKKESTVEK